MAYSPYMSPEDFFIEKIRAGSHEPLTEEEEKFLRSSVTDLFGDNTKFTPEQARLLNHKCTEALTKTYANDTSGGNREAGLIWRQNNEAIYRSPHAVISGIVQNWYLPHGRKQEKETFGLLAMVRRLFS